MKRAGAFPRVAAFFIDLLVLLVSALLLQTSSILGYALGSGGRDPGSPAPALPFLYALTGLFYFTYLTAHDSRTVGKRLMGIRVVRADGGNPGILRSLWRTCCYPASAFPFFFGFILAFVVKGRSLHDLLAGTVVIQEQP